jgi:dipeptidyl-peptidase-4
LGVARLNRHQNDLQILFANPKSGICTIAVSEKNERYIDQPSYTALTFLDDGLHFVYQSERDGYNHLYLYTMAGRMVKQLTQGDFDVTAFYGYDADTKTYYYQAAKKSPLEREVYSLNAKKGETCITPNTGTSTILFSPKFLYSIRSFNSATQPYYAKVYDKKSVELYTVVDNDELETM